jgi:hypothetical protein
VFQLRNNRAILASVGLSAAAWITSLSADVVDVSGDEIVLWVAVAPSTATHPTKHEQFWNVPGRRVGTITRENPAAVISPMMSKALSYKVKGHTPEEAPLACVVVGVMRKSKVTADETWNFGFRAGLRYAGQGFGAEAVDTPTT